MVYHRTALISVYHKDGIVDFVRSLVDMGWNILASGGTAKTLTEAGIPVTDVATLVGEPILGHRVVTLSRELFARLLGNYEVEADMQEMERLGGPIDLVCVDLYPLQEEIENPNATRESVIEKTDIGGPALLRAAAKGRRIVISHHYQRGTIRNWLYDGEPNRERLIPMLAVAAERIVGKYSLVSSWYHEGIYEKKKHLLDQL